jgi:hypothetical protein
MKPSSFLRTCTAVGLSVLAMACGRGSSGTSSPTASTSASAASTSASASGPQALTEFDLSGHANRHIRLAGAEEGRLQTLSMFTFTFNQLSDFSDSGTTADVLSLQGLVQIEVGAKVHVPAHLRIDQVVYEADACDLVITSLGPAEGPRHTRWGEGTFSCPEMTGPKNAKVTVANGHFVGPFVDLRPSP